MMVERRQGSDEPLMLQLTLIRPDNEGYHQATYSRLLGAKSVFINEAEDPWPER